MIIRLDGKAFHTFTKGCQKPFDQNIIDAMAATAKYLQKNIQGCELAYVQSDEISLFLKDYSQLETEAWFDYNVQKLCSVSASMASVAFTCAYNKHAMSMSGVKPAFFDARCFNIPKEEVANYFLWRFNDWVRNSISMLAQAHFSHKELHGKSQVDMHEMLHTKGINWNDCTEQQKNGTWIYNGVVEHHNIKEFNFRDAFIGGLVA